MDMNKFEMDELLRARMRDASAHVPDGVWERIAAQREGRRHLPFGWAGFSVLVLVTAIFSVWATVSSPLQIQSPPLHDNSNALQDQAVVNPSAPASTSEILSHSASDDASTEKVNASPASPSFDGSNAANPANNISNTKRFKETSASPAPTNVNKGSQSASESQVSLLSISGSDQAAHLTAAENTTESLFTQESQSQTQLSLLQLKSVRSMSGIAMDSWSPVLFFPSISKKRSSPDCYSFNSMIRGLSMDVFFSPEYAARQLVYKEPDLINYASLRKNTESYAFAYSAGLRLSAHFQGGLALRTGVVFTDIVEKLRFKDPNAEVNRIIHLAIDTVKIGNDIIIKYDTLSIVEYGTHEIVRYNNYRFYDIPLMLGYEFDAGRWIVHINTGLMVNVATARRGNMLDPTSNLVSIDSGDPDSYKAFRSKVGTSLLMSLGANYALTPKFHLLVEPQIRLWTRPVNLRDYPVDQKYRNFGLALGFRQYF